MNILLLTIGSHGDVHPFIGIGREMRRRGHRVTLFTNGYFESLARSAGLDFVSIAPADEYRSALHDKELFHPTRGFKAVMQRGVLPYTRATYDAIAAHHVPGQTILVGSSLAFGARIAQEKLNIPMATVHLSPAVFRTVYEPPKLTGFYMPRWLPKTIKSWMWHAGDVMVVDPIVAPAINDFRAELGLPPVKYLLRDWWNAPELVIGMFPPWYGKPQPDWPAQLRLTGFPLYDERDVAPLDAELMTFLESGGRPIVFTPGSAMIHAREFFEVSAKACLQIDKRAIFLTRFAEQIPANLPPTIKHFAYAPFSQFLHRCAAFVHHGGIGTTAQGLAAGVPQLIMPMSHDQPDNAERIKKLGVGVSIPEKHYTVARIAPLLNELTSSKQIAERCAAIALRMKDIDVIADTCALIEELEASKPLAPHAAQPATRYS